MMPTYIGVGDKTMCSICGVEVMSITRHDTFHAAIVSQLDKLRTENLELSVKVENLRRFANRKPNELVGV